MEESKAVKLTREDAEKALEAHYETLAFKIDDLRGKTEDVKYWVQSGGAAEMLGNIERVTKAIYGANAEPEHTPTADFRALFRE